MKVSVIITVYNLEKYVSDAIESVLAQTKKPLEIIVVNDGSSDNSEKEILKYKDHIRYISMEENKGVLPAIIAGIKESYGEIISFLDGDDIWFDNKIEKVSEAFEQYEDVFLITHNYHWIDSNSNRIEKTDKTHRNLRSIGGSSRSNYIENSFKLKKSIFGYKGVWLGSAFSIKKSCLRVQEFEADLLKYSQQSFSLSHQDQPLAAYLIVKNADKHIFFIDEELFKYRVFGENSSGSSTTREKAVKTIKRSKATTIYTSSILGELHDSAFNRERKIQQGKLHYFNYLLSLYANRKGLAFGQFLKFCLLDQISFVEFMKEITRMSGVILLGVDKFLHRK